MSAVSHSPSTTITPAAVNNVLATSKPDPALERILKFLRPNEVAGDRRVNNKFNKISHESRYVSEQVNVARRTQAYVNGQGQHEYFSAPCYSNRFASYEYFFAPDDVSQMADPVLSRNHLAKLAKRLEQRGNHAIANVERDVGFSPHKINPSWRGRNFRPTTIIAMIPKNEIAGLYKHMWEIIGCPQKVRAGEKAFHDKDGMHSTPAQKAEAICRFLKDEAMKYFAAQKNEKSDEKAK